MQPKNGREECKKLLKAATKIADKALSPVDALVQCNFSQYEESALYQIEKFESRMRLPLSASDRGLRAVIMSLHLSARDRGLRAVIENDIGQGSVDRAFEGTLRLRLLRGLHLRAPLHFSIGARCLRMVGCNLRMPCRRGHHLRFAISPVLFFAPDRPE